MSLGNIELQLGLNTSPATAALQKYYQKLNQGAKTAAQGQKPVETALNKLTESAKRLGITWDKTSKTFKDFRGNTRSIQDVQKQVQKLNTTLQQTKTAAQNSLKGIGAGFQSVLQGIPQGIGLAIGQQLLAPLTNFQSVVGGAVKSAVDGFVDIDKQLRQTLSISGESAARFDELSKAMNELAAQTKFTAGELSEASVQLARAGFTVDEIKEALPGIAQGAAAAGESIAGMSDVVIAALGGFQISTEETTDVVDVLTAAANSSNTSVVELGEGLKYVGPIAKNLGLTFEDTAAVAAVLANNGIKASQMGTALRQGLSRLGTAAAGTEAAMGDLSRGTANQAEVLSRLGVELQTAEGTLVPFPELLEKLRQGFSNLDSLEQGQAAKILFGTESATAFISLLNTSADEVQNFFDTTNNAQGTAAETAQQNLAGISGSLDLLRSAFDSASATVGKFISVALKPIVDGLTAAINVFNGLPEPIQAAVVILGTLSAVVVGVTAVWALLKAAMTTEFVTQITTGFSNLVVALTGVSTTIKGALLSALASAKAGLLAFNAQMTTSISLSGTASAAMAGIKAQLLAIGAAIKGFSVAGFFNALVTGFQSAGASAAAAATSIKGFLAAAAPLGVTAAAAGAVALAFDSYAQSVKGANEVAKSANSINEELTSTMDELGVSVAEVNDEWERSQERVGGVQAFLDIFREGLGLTTAETAQLNRESVALGESFGDVSDNVQSLIVEFNKEVQALSELEAGTEEYKDAKEKLEKSEKAISKAIASSTKELLKQKRELLGGRDSVEELNEAERTQLSIIDSLLEGFRSQDGALDGLAKAFREATGAAEAFNKAQEDADVENQKKAIEATKEAAKAAKEEFSKAKEDFEGTMQAAETAFNNYKEALGRGLDEEVNEIKAGVRSIKEEAEALTRINKGAISVLKEESDQLEESLRASVASIKAAGDAAVANLESQLKSTRAAIEAQTRALDTRYDKEFAQIEEASEASRNRYEGEVAGINAAAARTAATFAAQLDSINARKEAEAEAHRERIEDLNETADRVKESAERQIEAVRAVETERLRSLEETREAYKANSEEVLRNLESEEKRARDRYDAEKDSADRANAEILRNYDEQLDAINRAKDATESQYDSALDALRELTPAEQQLARIEEARLRAQAAQGGEEGLRAKAQLERAERDKQADALREQRAQALLAFEQQTAAVNQGRQEQELAYQQQLAQIEAARQDVLEQIAAREVKLREELQQRLEDYAATEQQIQDEADARAQQISDRAEARLERIELAKQKSAEQEAARQEALDAQAEAIEIRRAQAQAAYEKAAAAAAAAEQARQEKLAEQEEKLRQEKEQKELELKKKLEEAELLAEENIRAAKAQTAKEEKEARDEAAKQEKEIADTIKSIEQSNAEFKEKVRQAEKQGDADIAAAKARYKKAESDAEVAFSDTRNKLLRQYNEAIGKTTNYIIDQGVVTWTTYANNAVKQLARVQQAAINAARAVSSARAASSSQGTSTTSTSTSGITSNFAGGPIDGGRLTHINELGQEAFLGASGKLSWINAKANSIWRAPEAGRIIPADIAAGMGIPDKGIDLGKVTATATVDSMGAATRASGASNQQDAILRALSKMGGDTINNTVTIEAKNTTQAASDMLVNLTKIKNRRLR